MKDNPKHLIKLEFYSLCLLAFSLPILETAKHIFCITYLLLFTIRTFNHKKTFNPSPLGKYILIFIAGNIIASIGASLKGYDVEKLHDIIRYSLIGWMVLHTPLSRKQTYIILAIFILSTSIGIGDAYHSLSKGTENFFELRSVGHINHTAIYILLTLGISLPFLLKRQSRKIMTVIFIIINLSLIYVLLQTNSRATAIGLGFILMILIIVSFIEYKKAAYILCLLVCASIAYGSFGPSTKLVEKFNWYSTNFKNKLTPREKIWNTSFYAWKKEPIFGVGFGNYKVITKEKMQQWYKNTGIDVSDKKRFLYFSHTHNKYLNALTEGGVIGLASLLLLFSGILYYFLKQAKPSLHNKESIIFLLIGINTLSTISIVGLFNTTLHHEHGLLAMMLIGLSGQYLTSRSNNET